MQSVAPASSVGSPVLLSKDPAAGCWFSNGETAVAQSEAAGTAVHVATWGAGEFNWTSNSEVWQHEPLAGSPIPAPTGIDGGTSGDAWITSGSSANGLVYVSNILNPTGTGKHCIGIASSSPNNIASGVWTTPIACADTAMTTLPDGPSIVYDVAGTALWAVAWNNQIFTRVAPTCTGAAGGASCPMTTLANYAPSHGVYTHATVNINPCSHNAIVAYRASNGDAYLRFMKPDGTQSKLFMHNAVTGNSPLNNEDRCTGFQGAVSKCGGAASMPPDCGTTGCMTTSPKSQVTTKVLANGSCYAYVAYDFSCSVNQHRWKSALDVIDITNESTLSASSVKHRYISANCTQFSNHFLSQVGSVPNGNGVGWFWYTQQDVGSNPPEPCSTIFSGATSPDDGVTTLMAYTSQISGPFPSMRIFSNRGFGEYSVGAQRGIRYGTFSIPALFPVWSEPKQPAGGPFPGCATCQAFNGGLNYYTLGVYGSVVIP